MPDSAQTTRSPNGSSQRWHDFLEMAVSISKASGGALWKVENAAPVLLTQHQLGEQPLDKVHDQWPGHMDSLASVIQSLQSKNLDAQFEQVNGSQSLKLLLIPITSGSTILMILELFLPQNSTSSLEQVEDSIRQLLSWASPVNQAHSDSASVEFATWLAQIHRTLDLEETCFAITNETRTWSGWDRVSLLIRTKNQYQLKSVSGVDVLDPRSTTVTTLERAADSLANSTEPTVSTPDTPAPQLEEYQSRTQAKSVCAIPLVGEQSSTLGLLVFDQFKIDIDRIRTFEDLTVASRYIAVALGHAVRVSQLQRTFLGNFTTKLLSRKSAKWLLGITTMVATMLFLCCYQVTLTIGGTGYLEPAQYQDVFAVSNGLIQTLHVSQGEEVSRGDKLLTLRSPELEFEANRLKGELATVRQQRSDLETLRTDPTRVAQLGSSAQELAIREKELKTVAASLENQIALLKKQTDELILASPIDGEVITWNLKSLLAEDRPVLRTDRLLSVAQLTGDWRAKLHINDRDTGPVLQAIQQKTTQLTFLTADAPETRKRGVIQDVAPQVETDAINGTTLVVHAHVSREEIPNVRPGTSILYRIECGKAPIGYVWFRRVIDRVQSWWTLR